MTSSSAAHAASGTGSAPAPSTSLEMALDRLRAAEDFPAVSGRLHHLMEQLADEGASVQQLANFLLQDYGLTLRLLRTANSFRFNRSGTPIVSITHAIVMMGIRTVRDILSSIIVFEHYQRRSPGLRELLMLSLLTANHARELSDRLGGVAGEKAYLLGLLRNLGEVLVACYLPDKYAAILRDLATHGSTPEISCRRVLHFSYEQLAIAVLKDWNIPGIEDVLAEPPPRSAEGAHGVIALAHALTNAVYRQRPEHSRHAIALVKQKYSYLRLKPEDVTEVLEAGLAATSETFRQAGVKIDELQLQHQMNAALLDAPLTEVAAAAAADQPERVSQDRAAALLALVQSALSDRGLDLNKLVLLILETTISAGGFDRAALGLVSGPRREVVAWFALGAGSERVLERLRFALGPTGGAPGIAISRGQELIVAKEWDLLAGEHRLLRTLDAGCLVLFPVTINGNTIGVLYADTTSQRVPSDAALVVARRMRDAIVTAMNRGK
jgi:HD-like signal output (HDOD) protein